MFWLHRQIGDCSHRRKLARSTDEKNDKGQKRVTGTPSGIYPNNARQIRLYALLSPTSMRNNHNHQTHRPSAIDLFCGVGGMSLGFEAAGFDLVSAIDISQINIQSYQQNFPTTDTFAADISELCGSEILSRTNSSHGSIDVVFGGPPCQGYSNIGRREKDDRRNEMIFHFARLVEEIGPRYFVLENVPGIMNGYGAKNIQSFKKRLGMIGYEIPEEARVLNSLDFGVPQNRRRAFIIGNRSGLLPAKFPETGPTNSANGNISNVTVWDAISDLQSIDQHTELIKAGRYYGPLGQPSEFATVLRADTPVNRDDVRKFLNGKGLGGCTPTQHTRKTIQRFSSTKPGQTDKISRAKRLHPEGVSTTLRAGTGPDRGSHTAVRPVHPVSPRYITIREAARLHSFPDWFEFHPTKWHGLRQIGNSVPPLLAERVAHKILDILQEG